MMQQAYVADTILPITMCLNKGRPCNSAACTGDAFDMSDATGSRTQVQCGSSNNSSLLLLSNLTTTGGGVLQQLRPAASRPAPAELSPHTILYSKAI